jgi:hypothetical protein
MADQQYVDIVLTRTTPRVDVAPSRRSSASSSCATWAAATSSALT